MAPELTRPIGAFLVLFAAAVWFVGTPPVVPRLAAADIAAVNALWAAGSVVLALVGASSPTTAGTVWIVMQPLVVAAFAVLQALAMRSGGAVAVPVRPNSSAISS